jgi:hypothetical protein
MTDMELLAIHGLAVKKAGSPGAVAEILGADESDVQAALDTATADGRVTGAKGTFMVTPAGRAWLSELYPEVYTGLRADPAAGEAYERFERLNRQLLALMTDWQMVPAGTERVPNDHADADYDHDIIDKLGALHERAHRPLEQFASLEPRLEQYWKRLESAYDKVLAGDHDWVSGPRIDSYHTVWFELHEDLLRMLGRERQEQA